MSREEKILACGCEIVRESDWIIEQLTIHDGNGAPFPIRIFYCGIHHGMAPITTIRNHGLQYELYRGTLAYINNQILHRGFKLPQNTHDRRDPTNLPKDTNTQPTATTK